MPRVFFQINLIFIPYVFQICIDLCDDSVFVESFTKQVGQVVHNILFQIGGMRIPSCVYSGTKNL